MGLEGTEVSQWIREQHAFLREERQREREERQVERAEKQAEREEIQLAEIQDSATRQSQPLTFRDPVTRTTLPGYKDEDDIATYLVRFERVAALLKIDIVMLLDSVVLSGVRPLNCVSLSHLPPPMTTIYLSKLY